MEKLIRITLMTLILLTLSGCNTNNESTSNTSVLIATTNDIENTISTTDLVSNEPVESEIVSEVKSSETTDDEIPEETSTRLRIKDIIYSDDAVIYELHKTYYNDAGGIVVEGLIINVTDHVAGSMILKKLELFNENDELIATNAFGAIQEYYGACYAGEKLEISFMFPSVNVYIKDDDLDSVRSVSRFTSEHW